MNTLPSCVQQVVEFLLGAQQDAQQAGEDVIQLRGAVKHDFRRFPNVAALGDGQLDHLGGVVDFVHGLQDSHTVVVGNLKDGGHGQLEELGVVVVDEEEEVAHLILEFDVAAVVVLGHEALASEVVKHVF